MRDVEDQSKLKRAVLTSVTSVDCDVECNYAKNRLINPVTGSIVSCTIGVEVIVGYT